MAVAMEHEPHGAHQTKKAAASGWIGSALEYYDFFIYASAASLIFPQIFFPSDNPQIAIIASLATYGVGYVARPIGAFFLGHWGDTHGRKTVLLLCMFLMGFSTMAVGVPADLPAGRHARPVAARRPASDPGLRGRRGNLRRKFDDSRARSVRPARLLRQLQPAGRAGRADPRRGGLPAARALPAPGGVHRPGAGGFRFSSASSSSSRATSFAARSQKTPGLRRRGRARRGPKAPIVQAFKHSWKDMLRVVCMALMNVIPVVATIFGGAYAVQPAYGISFRQTSICGSRSWATSWR